MAFARQGASKEQKAQGRLQNQGSHHGSANRKNAQRLRRRNCKPPNAVGRGFRLHNQRLPYAVFVEEGANEKKTSR